MSVPTGRSPRILVVRRDNIGDLLCTTPLLRGIRKTWPDAWLAVLVSSYNAEAIAGNPDIDEIFVFPKRQQRRGSLLDLGLKRWRMERSIRSRRFDEVILANGGWRYARRLGGRRMIGFRERDNPDHKQPDVVVPLADGRAMHEVEKLAALGRALGVGDAQGPLCAFPARDAVAAVHDRLVALGFRPDRPSLALHISSRRPQQRWPEASFAELMRRLHARFPLLQFLLFWSPGAEDDPMHPGDDGKAARLQAAVAGLPLFPCPTGSVRELLGAMSLADRVVCSDGGGLHVAAALGKPTVCFFGDSIAAEWRPWGVPYVLLQPASKRVADIGLEEALDALDRLDAMSEAPAGSAS
ncbi:MAG TPA: glycosyltransferase family 9 protein [Rhodocyclaceae bacterium]